MVFQRVYMHSDFELLSINAFQSKYGKEERGYRKIILNSCTSLQHSKGE